MIDPVQVIVAAFSTPDGAGKVMDDLKQGRKAGLIGIVDAAVVVKDADGKIKVTDSKRRGVRGFVTGGVVGGLVGLLVAPPVAAVAATGGVIGALVGKLKGAPLKSEMQSIGSALTPNSSAIVAVIEHSWVSQLQAALIADGAQLIQDAIKADIAEQLNAGGNVLYTIAGGDSGSGAARIASTSEGTEVSGIIVGENGMIVENAIITNESAEETNAPVEITAEPVKEAESQTNS
jgi:uncharacterized membrane protein